MSRRRPPRELRSEEHELWRSVAQSTRPLHSGRPAPAPPSMPEPMPSPPSPPEATAPIEPFRIGALRASTAAAPRVATDLAPGPVEQLGSASLRMDAKAHRRLKRGKLIPEGRLDLHGLTLDAAQPRLSRFIIASQAAGHRLVLVITGKGRGDDDRGPIPQRAGALRHEVPLWLARPPLGPLVQQVVPAHPRHGGGGAYYVWLRRSR